MKKRLLTGFMVLVMLLFTGCGSEFSEFDDEDYDDKDIKTTESITTQTESSINDTNDSKSDMTSSEIAKVDNKSKQALIESGAIREQQVKLKGNGEDTVTVLIYMNGSNLETDDSSATKDLEEMIKAGESDKVNVIIQTMGTKKWNKKYGIASDRSQIYSMKKDGLTLVKDDLGQLNCTKAETLSDFIKWGVANYPADRYILLFWDHGGGPIYGFGYDDNNEDSEESMSMAEMRQGLLDGGVFFDFIGMDCCIMASLEVGCALYDFCDYSILSEDFESGLGWSYTTWLSKLYANSSIPTVELGKCICDTMVSANEEDSKNGDKSIMAVVDESMMKILYSTWVDFAYANKRELLGTNYSKHIKRKNGGRILPIMKRRDDWDDWDDDYEYDDDDYDEDDYDEYYEQYYDDDTYDWDDDYDYDDGTNSDDPNMADYYVTDIMAVAQNIKSDESDALASALAQSLIYVSTSSGEVGLTGLSVTLPYGDDDFYTTLKTVFSSIGIHEEYIAWLKDFTSVKNQTSGNGGKEEDNYYDYDEWYDEWDWDDFDNDFDWTDYDDWDDEDWEYDWDDWDDWDWQEMMIAFAAIADKI